MNHDWWVQQAPCCFHHGSTFLCPWFSFKTSLGVRRCMVNPSSQCQVTDESHTVIIVTGVGAISVKGEDKLLTKCVSSSTLHPPTHSSPLPSCDQLVAMWLTRSNLEKQVWQWPQHATCRWRFFRCHSKKSFFGPSPCSQWIISLATSELYDVESVKKVCYKL